MAMSERERGGDDVRALAAPEDAVGSVMGGGAAPAIFN